MLSFGSAAFNRNGDLVGTFTRNLETIEGSQPDPETAKWWATQPEAWEACRKDLVAPTDAMKGYVTWLKELPGKPVFVGYPATFDFIFVYWYLIRFAGESPFGFQGLDMKSYAMCLMDIPFRQTTKRNMPKSWFSKDPHNHIALDDAIGQGRLFINLLRKRRKLV